MKRFLVMVFLWFVFRQLLFASFKHWQTWTCSLHSISHDTEPSEYRLAVADNYAILLLPGAEVMFYNADSSREYTHRFPVDVIVYFSSRYKIETSSASSAFRQYSFQMADVWNGRISSALYSGNLCSPSWMSRMSTEHIYRRRYCQMSSVETMSSKTLQQWRAVHSLSLGVLSRGLPRLLLTAIDRTALPPRYHHHQCTGVIRSFCHWTSKCVVSWSQ